MVTLNAVQLVYAEGGDTLSAEEAAIVQKKLDAAQLILKKAVKNVPEIGNAGTTKGVVTCARSRTNADVIVFIEKVGDNVFDPPKEHAVVDQLNLTYVPHVTPFPERFQQNPYFKRVAANSK